MTAAWLDDASLSGCAVLIGFEGEVGVHRLAHGCDGLAAKVVLGRCMHRDIHALSTDRAWPSAPSTSFGGTAWSRKPAVTASSGSNISPRVTVRLSHAG